MTMTKAVPMTTVSMVTTTTPVPSTGLLTSSVAKQPLILSEEMEEEEEENVSSTVTPSHYLATKRGLDTSRIQNMKASFFTDTDPTHIDSAHFNITTTKPVLKGMAKNILTTPTHTRQISHDVENLSTFVPPSPLSNSLLLGQPLPREQVNDTIYHPPTPLVVQPVFVSRRKLDTLVAMDTSIVNGCSGWSLDMGMSMGRSFRANWGPNWSIIHSGSPSFDHGTSGGHVMGRVTIERVDPSPWMKKELLSGNIKVSVS